MHLIKKAANNEYSLKCVQFDMKGEIISKCPMLWFFTMQTTESSWPFESFYPLYECDRYFGTLSEIFYILYYFLRVLSLSCSLLFLLQFTLLSSFSLHCYFLWFLSKLQETVAVMLLSRPYINYAPNYTQHIVISFKNPFYIHTIRWHSSGKLWLKPFKFSLFFANITMQNMRRSRAS